MKLQLQQCSCKFVTEFPQLPMMFYYSAFNVLQLAKIGRTLSATMAGAMYG